MTNNTLKYLIKSSDSYPCFVWPVVENNDGLYLALSNEKQTVTSFRKIDSLSEFEIVISIPDAKIVINEGSETIFAYAFDENRYFYDTLDVFSEKIKGFLKSEPEAVGEDVFKKYALYSKIDADAKINKILVDIIENETDNFLFEWAKSKIIERKRTRIVLPIPEKYRHARNLCPTIRQLKSSLANSDIPFLVNLANELTESSILQNDYVLERERNVHGGYVNILSADLQKTELAENVLDAMAGNMTDTAYKVCTAQADIISYSDVIYEIKARVLERNIVIDTKENFEFFDISEVPYALELQNILKNIIFWECEKGEKESYLLMVKKDVWEESLSMEPFGNKVGYITIPYAITFDIFNYLLTHEKTRKIAA